MPHDRWVIGGLLPPATQESAQEPEGPWQRGAQLQHRMPAIPTEQFIPSVARQRHRAVLGHLFGQRERG